MATFEEQFNARKAEGQANVNQAFDNSLNNSNKALQDAYTKNMATQNQATADTESAYSGANQQIQQQLAQTQRQMDEFADVRDLNRQAGSQQAISMNMGNRRATGSLNAQRSQALMEAQRQSELTTLNHQNQMKQALADNDFRRAAAIMDQENRDQSWLEQNAQFLMQLGDYSGARMLYGEPTANNMRMLNAASDPDAAYNAGLIDAATYKRMTGYDSPQAKANAGRGGGGGYYGGGGYSTSLVPEGETADTNNPLMPDRWTYLPGYSEPSKTTKNSGMVGMYTDSGTGQAGGAKAAVMAAKAAAKITKQGKSKTSSR